MIDLNLSEGSQVYLWKLGSYEKYKYVSSNMDSADCTLAFKELNKIFGPLIFSLGFKDNQIYKHLLLDIISKSPKKESYILRHFIAYNLDLECYVHIMNVDELKAVNNRTYLRFVKGFKGFIVFLEFLLQEFVNPNIKLSPEKGSGLPILNEDVPMGDAFVPYKKSPELTDNEPDEELIEE